jgi:hypothetical protein
MILRRGATQPIKPPVAERVEFARLSRYSLSKGVSIISTILSGDLMFADRAILDSRVELPKPFRKAYPRVVRLHVTNYLWNPNALCCC